MLSSDVYVHTVKIQCKKMYKSIVTSYLNNICLILEISYEHSYDQGKFNHFPIFYTAY